MTATPDTASSPGIRSLIPARVDRLPWSKFHIFRSGDPRQGGPVAGG